MALSKSEAEKQGLKFSIEGEARPEAPDQDIFEADLTIDGHTEKFAGKSEEDVLAQAEKVLKARGRGDDDGDEAGESEPATAQFSDVADLEAFRAQGQRDETDEELLKQYDEGPDGPGPSAA